jgi:hypothetical protein
MRYRLAVASLALFLVSGASQADGQPVDVELVLAVDVSRSMDLHEFAVQRDGYLRALRHPDLIRAIAAGRIGRVAIAYFEWSGQPRDGGLVPWRIIETPEDAAAMADEIAAMPIRRGRGTSISRALSFAALLIEDDTVDGAQKVIDVSGDGANNIGPPVTGARDAVVAKGITINGLPVMASPGRAMADLERYYEGCVIGGLGSFVMVAHEDEDFAQTIGRKLILEISGRVPPPRLVRVDFEPVDCLIGEKEFRWRFNR